MCRCVTCLQYYGWDRYWAGLNHQTSVPGALWQLRALLKLTCLALLTQVLQPLLRPALGEIGPSTKVWLAPRCLGYISQCPFQLPRDPFAPSVLQILMNMSVSQIAVCRRDCTTEADTLEIQTSACHAGEMGHLKKSRGGHLVPSATSLWPCSYFRACSKLSCCKLAPCLSITRTHKTLW